MKSIDEIERLLAQTGVPNLLDGAHREQLKRQLLEQAASQPTERRTMMSVFRRIPPMFKVAAAVLAAAILVGSGWAGEKIYKKLTEPKATVTLEEDPPRPWTLPNGMTFYTGGSIVSTVVDSDDPKAIEKAKRRHEEMKRLIAQKQYKFLRAYEGPEGKKQYEYRFTLADGSQKDMNFVMPLESVASWDDYRGKLDEQRQRARDGIGKAVAAGKFRLIDVDVICIHVCRDAGSDEKIKVQRIPLGEGKEIALIRPFDPEAESRATIKPQTSWEAHLQAVREGKREILSLEPITDYTYEVVLEDGSKTIFSYGGGDPLKKP